MSEFQKVKIGPKEIEIPMKWTIEKIESVVTTSSGGTPSRSNNEYFGGTIDWLKSGELNDNIIYDTEEKITEDALKNSSAKLFPKGTLLVAMYGVTAGKIAILNTESTTNQAICALFPNEEKLHTKYLMHYLIFMRNHIISISSGGAQPNISQELIKNFDVIIPPLPEQQKISKILSTVDELITKTDEVIEKNKQLKKGLFQGLLTKGIGHKEFKKVKIGHKEVGIPDNWNLVKLKDIGDIKPSNVDKKSVSDEKPVKLCNYLDVYNNDYITSNMEFMEATATIEEIEKFRLNIGDVIITKDSETPDDIAQSAVVIVNIENLLCGYHLAIIRPNTEIIQGRFLSKSIKSNVINGQFISLAQGLTRYGLTFPSIKNVSIPLPPIEEQEKISEILSIIDSKITQNEKYNNHLKFLKKGLMQQLLTGKLRVAV